MNYQYIDHSELKDLIGSGTAGKDYAVVDVRDDDFTGGNIVGAIRAPTGERTDQSVDELADKLRDVPKVVFHCSLSQVRGPKAARMYAEKLTERAGPSAASAGAKNDSAEAAATFSPSPYEHKVGSAQQVYVLRDGFANWQALYKSNPRLVENYDEKVWSTWL